MYLAPHKILENNLVLVNECATNIATGIYMGEFQKIILNAKSHRRMHTEVTHS